MDMDQETQKKIQGLQMLEQGYQNIVYQKQTFQIEVNETNTALSEVEKSKSDVFRILGQVMVKADKASLKKELKEKSDILNLRMKTIEKQELQMREEIERIRNEIMDKVK
jgi:prefoldin beta subunit